jgi:outer membrane biosynthesis protein TonB
MFHKYVKLLAGVGSLLFLFAHSLRAAQVTLAWDPTPTANIAGYRLHCGTTSRVYTQQIEVGKATTTMVSNLVDGVTYFFMVTAYDTASSESAPSNEVSYSVPRSTPAPTPSPTPTPASTPTPTPMPSATPTPSVTPTPAPSATPTPAPSATPTPAPSPTSTPTTARAKLSTLSDNFGSNSLDPNRWMKYQGTNYSVGAASQQLRVINSVNCSNWGGIFSTNQYDATNSGLSINLVQPGNSSIQTAVWTWAKLKSNRSNANAVEIGVHAGRLYAKRFVARTGITLASTTYNAARMQWLRVRESAGVTYWEYAANYQGPWTILFSAVDPIVLTSVSVEMGVGAWPGTSGTLLLKNVNTGPSSHSQVGHQGVIRGRVRHSALHPHELQRSDVAGR